MNPSVASDRILGNMLTVGLDLRRGVPERGEVLAGQITSVRREICPIRHGVLKFPDLAGSLLETLALGRVHEPGEGERHSPGAYPDNRHTSEHLHWHRDGCEGASDRPAIRV